MADSSTATGEGVEHPPGGSPDTIEPAGPPHLRRVVLNLLLLSTLGVGSSLWFWLYTEWFPVIVGLLGLGGVLTWVAFLSGLLTEERKKQLQGSVDRSLLQSRVLWQLMLAAALLFVVMASLSGAIVLRSSADSQDRTVRIDRLPDPVAAGRAPSDDDDSLGPTLPVVYLPAHAVHRLLLWPQWRMVRYRVRVSGYPPLQVTLSGFGRRTIFVPGSVVVRPVVLVRMPPRVRANVSAHGMELVVRHGRPSETRHPEAELQMLEVGRIQAEDLASGAVWIGCGRDCDVSIPEQQLELWRQELGDAAADSNRWREPHSLARDLFLEPEDRIELELWQPDSEATEPYASGALTIRVAGPGGDFIQHLYLEV